MLDFLFGTICLLDDVTNILELIFLIYRVAIKNPEHNALYQNISFEYY